MTADLNNSTGREDQTSAIGPNFEQTVQAVRRVERNKTPTIWTEIGRGTQQRVNREYKNVSVALGGYIGKLDELT